MFKIKDTEWKNFGKWMMITSGIVLIALALYNEKDVISLLLRIWSGLFGIGCIYLGLTK